MRNAFVLLFLFSAVLFSNCKTRRNGAPDSTCTRSGTVIDMSGLDGCSLLIQLEDGRKLLPVMDAYPDIELKEGMAIQFDYTALEDYSSVCMAEDLIGKISCLEIKRD